MASQTTLIPTFFLFGEPPQLVGRRFLHMERIDERSRPNAWNIRSHAHEDLTHIFSIESGSGALVTEGEWQRFGAPCALVIPARAVHGFDFEPETQGRVLTVSDAFLHDLVSRDPELGELFGSPLCVELSDDIRLEERFEVLARELSWIAPGHAAAVEAQLLGLLVDLLRLSRRRADPVTAPGRAAELVARFRALIERDFREPVSVSRYARELGVTSSRLRDACLKVARTTPVKLVHARKLLEARRALLYTDMPVAEIAFYLGCEDPAYFSRFFTKGVGVSPRAFRNGIPRSENAA